MVTSCSSDSGGDLLKAVRDGDSELSESLINQGADPNFQNENGITPIHIAARTNRHLTRMLLKAGANIDSIDAHGHSVLHHAILGGWDISQDDTGEWVDNYQFKIVDFLINEGADTKHVDNDGLTLIHTLSSFPVTNPDDIAHANTIVEYLFDSGFDVDAKSIDGSTALHAVGLAGMAQLLINKGANVNALNSFGDTPLQSAFRRFFHDSFEADDSGIYFRDDPDAVELIRILILNGALHEPITQGAVNDSR